MTAPVPVAPSTPTDNGRVYRGKVNQLPINAGDPVWVGQDGADTDVECFMTDDYIAQVGDRVLYVKEGRYGILLGKIAPQPGWGALAGMYGANIADFGGAYDVGSFIKLGTIVYLRGLIKTTATVSAGATILTMPTGCGMAAFSTNGAMFFAGAFAASGALSQMRLRLLGYALIMEAPSSVVSGVNIALTGLCWPADI